MYLLKMHHCVVEIWFSPAEETFLVPTKAIEVMDPLHKLGTYD